jgi:hypothetical protein
VNGILEIGQVQDISCFSDGNSCNYKYFPCGVVPGGPSCLKTRGSDYTDSSAVFVLISAIVVFFMKAGFMLLESSFAETDEEKRQIIIIKNTDVFASAFGYFLIGCDFVAGVVVDGYPVPPKFFSVQEPLLWFFKSVSLHRSIMSVGVEH